jgi:hypothetical protein
MRNSTDRLLAVAALAASLVILVGCGGKPMPFPTPESELGDRPGLFTGGHGTWELSPPEVERPQPR